jgi:hypothetical protein
MSEAAIVIRLDNNGRVYQPGETLSGEYLLAAAVPGTVKTIEVSVLWYSEGKGDEDLAVHEFWRRSAEDGSLMDPGRPQRFSTTLPSSPLSYDGAIIRLCWCVRVRAFLDRGKELVGQQTFRLGNVPAARAQEA